MTLFALRLMVELGRDISAHGPMQEMMTGYELV